jgi:hypothetical protein
MMQPQSVKQAQRVSSEAKNRREKLLNMIKDGFTPSEAAVAWKMSIAQVNNMTKIMREKFEIVPSGTTRNRIFFKVKKDATPFS